MHFKCEHCNDPIPAEEYFDLSDSPEYRLASGHICHTACVDMYPSVVIRSTETLSLVMSVEEEDENLSNL